MLQVYLGLNTLELSATAKLVGFSKTKFTVTKLPFINSSLVRTMQSLGCIRLLKKSFTIKGGARHQFIKCEQQGDPSPAFSCCCMSSGIEFPYNSTSPHIYTCIKYKALIQTQPFTQPIEKPTACTQRGSSI